MRASAPLGHVATPRFSLYRIAPLAAMRPDTPLIHVSRLSPKVGAMIAPRWPPGTPGRQAGPDMYRSKKWEAASVFPAPRPALRNQKSKFHGAGGGTW